MYDRCNEDFCRECLMVVAQAQDLKMKYIISEFKNDFKNTVINYVNELVSVLSVMLIKLCVYLLLVIVYIVLVDEIVSW